MNRQDIQPAEIGSAGPMVEPRPSVRSRPQRRLWRRDVAFGGRRLSGLVLLGLIGLPFVLFAAETLALRVFYFHDIQYYFIPYHQLVARYLREGVLPLWNPYAFSGIPLLGDGQTAIFYPPSWLFLVLPAQLAMNWAILSQFSVAGVGMFLFTREVGTGRAAALLAALAFMFNGFLTSRMVHLSIMSGAALIPLVFWAAERLRKQRTSGRLAVAALVVAMQAFAGHPQVPVYTATALVVYLLVQAFASAPRGRGLSRMASALVGLGAIYVAGYSLAAIQLLPWVDFARLSPRAASASFGLVAGQSLVGVDWLLLIMPYIFGGVRSGFFSPGQPYLPQAIFIWERAAYVGILPLVLAMVGLLGIGRVCDETARTRRATLLALGAVLVVGVAIAGGRDTAIAQVVYATPVLGKLRAYSRAITLLCFAVPALAALGLQELIDASRPGRLPTALARRLLVVATVPVLVFGFVLEILPGMLRAAGNLQRTVLAEKLVLTGPVVYVPVLLVCGSLVLLLWWSWRGVRRGTLLAALGLVAVDMLVFAYAFNPTTVPSELTEIPPSVEFLRRDQSFFRVASFIAEEKIPPSVARAQLAMSWGMAFGIPHINGFNSLQPRRYTDLLFGPNVEDVSYGFLASNALLQDDSHILSMLNTRYVLVQPDVKAQPGPGFIRVYQDADVTILRNQRAYPHAYFAAELYSETDPEKALSIVKHPTFDARNEAVIEAPLDRALLEQLMQAPEIEPDYEAQRQSDVGRDPDVNTLPSPSVSGRATVEQVSPTHLRIATDVRRDRYLVIGEMFMPGWTATIDGQPAPMYRTNYVLRGMIVPAGQHTINMVYRPLSAWLGVIMSLLAVLTLGLAIVAERRGWRKRAGDARLLRALREGKRTRQVAMLLVMLLFGLLAYWPNRYFFRSTGDIVLYEEYARRALAQPRTYPREYPAPSALIFVIPAVLPGIPYRFAFPAVAAIGAAAMVLVVERLSRRGWWLVLYLVLGGFATVFFRYDSLVVVLTVLAFAAGTRRRWGLAQLLLGIGIALKLYPAVLMPLVVLWEWRVTRRLPWRSAIAGALALGLAIGSMWLLAPSQIGEMLRYHADRPLEIESTGASLAWLLGDTRVDFSFGSWNLLSAASSTIIPATTGLTIGLSLVLYAAFALGWFGPGAIWAMVLLVSIATSKVFSTQYLLWVLPFVVLALGEQEPRSAARFAWVWAVICLLTGLVYPTGFAMADATMVTRQTPDGLMALITVRNVLWIVATLMAVRVWARVKAPDVQPSLR